MFFAWGVLGGFWAGCCYVWYHQLTTVKPFTVCSGSWVSRVIDRLKMSEANGSILLRCAQTCMSEKLLDSSQICAAFEKVRSKAMAQAVRVDFTREPSSLDGFLQAPANASGA